jgi:tRNA(fMet)-specific endonuclease VapC
MTFALDTNIVSYVLKNSYNLRDKIANVLDAGNFILIPPIAFYETLRGLYLNNSMRRLELFYQIFQKFIQSNMDYDDWVQAAQVYAHCVKTGHSISDDDLLQGAFCLRHGYVLVTHNTKHFVHIKNLVIEDWVS